MIKLIFATLLILVGLVSSSVQAQDNTLYLTIEQFDVIRGEPVAIMIEGRGSAFNRLDFVLNISGDNRFNYTDTVKSFIAPEGWSISSEYDSSRLSVHLVGSTEWIPNSDPLVFILGSIDTDALLGSVVVQLISGTASLVGNPVFVDLGTSGGITVLDACLKIDFTMQGGRRPVPIGYVFPLHVKYTNKDYSAYSSEVDVSTNHLFRGIGRAEICGLRLGEHEIKIKETRSLSNLALSVPIISTTNSIYMGVLKSGDANDDDIIDILDFGALAGAFGSYPGHLKWDPRADFDRNLVVNISDFGLLSLNFLQYGPVIVEIPSETIASPTHTWVPPIGEVCRGAHVWGYHRGGGGQVAISYLDTDLAFKVFSYHLNPSSFIGNYFTVGVSRPRPAVMHVAALLYLSGIHLPRAKFFNCQKLNS